MRIDSDTYFMNIALSTSLRSTCPRAQVGAVLVYNGDAIAAGYNGSPKGTPHCEDEGCIMAEGKCIRSVHAETNILMKSTFTSGAAIYVTHQPCLVCSHLIINARIAKVIYGRIYIDPRCTLFGVQSQDEYLRNSGVEVEYLALKKGSFYYKDDELYIKR